MTVGELIGELKQCNPNYIVMASIDDEGNGYHPVDMVDDNCILTEHGDMKLRKLTKELKARGFAQEDVGEGQAAVVLW